MDASAVSTGTGTPQPSPALPSSFAAGRYEVKSFLGEGGRKNVYLAHDAKLDREVAVAVIKTDGLDEAGLVRVRREAQAMGRLGDHHHIVTVFDIGEERGEPIIVSQFMAGGDLAELIQQAPDHQLAIEDAIRIAGEICEGLSHAHARSIVHRDLKPANIWLTEDGTAKIGDFGLAVALDRSRLTMSGMMIGTVGYMPPEQAMGRQSDARSDLYSVGCILYEMVTGEAPFIGEDVVAVISQHINTVPVSPSYHNAQVSRSLETIIMRLLAKAPEERPASAAEVAAELRRIRDTASQSVSAEQVLATSGVTALQSVPWGRFVGRRDEMSQLKAALESALSGRGSIVMLVGEPGIGKSRLAKEFAVYAGLRGAQVLSGRCYESEASIPYLPLMDALRQYVVSKPEDELRQELGSGAPEIATFISEIRQRLPDTPEAPSMEDEADRLRMFESVSSFLRNAAKAAPLILLLDDLQWSDRPSLLLLQYLARGIATERIMILGCYSDVEVEESDALSETLAALRREQFFQRVVVKGLPQDDVLALMTTLGEQEVPPEFVKAIYRETEGNPLFVEEILKHLVEEGKLSLQSGQWVSSTGGVPQLDIPEGIRDIVRRRLSRLSEDCRGILTLASAMTSGFTFELLREVSGESDDSLLDLVEEALALHAIRERKGTVSGSSYELAHTALRHTLYGELSAPRRVRLHRQIGEALERLHAANLEPHLAELAYHYANAAPGGDVDKAIDYARRAGERATALLAHEEAVRAYRLALRALDVRGGEDTTHCELLLELGEAQTKAGQGERAVETLKEAFALTERLDDAALMARAALTHKEAMLRTTEGYSGGAVPMLRRALEALGTETSPTRVYVLAGLADLPSINISAVDQIELGREALEVARDVDDPGAILMAHQALLTALGAPEYLGERLELAQELIRLGAEADDRYGELWGHIRLMIALLGSGDVDGVDRELEIIYPRAAETREPAWIGRRPSWTAMRSAMQGKWEEAERSLQEILAAYQELQVAWLLQAAGVLTVEIRRGQGRLAEVEGLITAAANQNPAPAWKGAQALAFCDTGHDDDAKQLFDELAVNDFEDLPRDWILLAALSMLVHVARHLKDADRARTLYKILLPYGEQHIVMGDAVLYWGSVATVLGIAATTAGEWENAEEHFGAAIEAEERCRAWPYLARAKYEYAEMLTARGEDGDKEKALSLVNEALDRFQELAMQKDTENALALKVDLQGIDTTDTSGSIEAVASLISEEQPNLRRHAAPDGTVTLLFSDIEGSTALTERLGDQRWLEMLREHNVIVREQLAAHEGFEVKSVGDGFMLAFQSARAGINCAIGIQRSLAERNDSTAEPVQVRIGLHTGEVIKEGDDFFGKHVILAARVASQAAGGEILVSSLLHELTSSGGDIEFGEPRAVELKGLTGMQEMFLVSWQSA
jgi:class 3 adenylate cyclase